MNATWSHDPERRRLIISLAFTMVALLALMYVIFANG
jgi:hypothetical protein